MANDFAFDPVTRDLIRDGKGSWQMTATAATMVMHQIWCHAFAWWGSPELGSFLHDLTRFQSNPEVMIPDEWNRALGVVVGRGRISNVKVIAQLEKPGRVVGLATFQDVGTGQVVDTFAKAGGG